MHLEGKFYSRVLLGVTKCELGSISKFDRNFESVGLCQLSGLTTESQLAILLALNYERDGCLREASMARAGFFCNFMSANSQFSELCEVEITRGRLRGPL